jgi:hypothetical protein
MPKTVLGVRGAPVGRGDQGVQRQEGCRNADGAVEQPTRIVAQIEHQALQRAGLEQVLKMLDHRRAGIFLERGDAQIAVTVLDEFRLDALHLDDFARQRDFQRFGLALAEIDSLICDFGLPRMRLTASFSVSPLTSVSSILKISRPALPRRGRPACPRLAKPP